MLTMFGKLSHASSTEKRRWLITALQEASSGNFKISRTHRQFKLTEVQSHRKKSFLQKPKVLKTQIGRFRRANISECSGR